MLRAIAPIILALAATACTGDPLPPTTPTPAALAGVASMEPAAGPSIVEPTQDPPREAVPAVPASPADAVAGSYALAITVERGCEALPSAATHRSYFAHIEDRNSSFVVTLSGATFLTGPICTAAPSGLGCNQFVGSHAGNSIHFDLLNENDDGHGGHIVEQIAADLTWLEMTGAARGQRHADGTIVATGSANLWYCAAGLDYPFPCPTHQGCRSDALHMVFTPR